MKKISIIIPCKEINSITKKCVSECLKLDYADFEILVLPDYFDKKILKKFLNEKVKIINTGKVKPAFKRNLGMKKAKGEFFAFIDSDAYPEKDWLKNAMKYFEDKKVGVVGGPNLTPPEVNFWEKISGYTLSNFLASGNASIRYKKSKNCFVKELPSCNYISRKEISPEYDPSFLTAEDSEFCFNITKKGYKIRYAKDVVVYHHRRNSLKGHLKQMFVYGRDIAWLTKKDFSLDKTYYFILSLFIISFFMGVTFSFFNEFIRSIFLIALLIYIFLIFITSIHENLKITILTSIVTILTHFSYGIGFLSGATSKKREEKCL